MDQILDRLYLGDFTDAEAVTLDQCTCVLTLNEVLPVLTSPFIVHVHRPTPDEVYLPPYIWGGLVTLLAEALHQEDAVLVHCRLGVSRSPSLVAAYLYACGYAKTVTTALAYLVSRRSVVAPHSETWKGILEWETD